MAELVEYGVPLRAIPTYLVLSDHAANHNGRTNVSLKKIAEVLKVHRRTVERHLADLEGAGVVKRQSQQRSQLGKFSSCICYVISFAFFAVRQGASCGPRRERKNRTKPSRTTPQTPQGAKVQSREERTERRYDEYRWLFGMEDG
jgi:DNA-binding transcriptional ArsR family regulator